MPRVCCPFEGCAKTFVSQKTLKKHILDSVSSRYDQKHSPNSPHFTAIVSKPRQTLEERAEKKRTREQKRYQTKKKLLYPLQSELEDFALDWKKEAAYLKTPHHEKGTYIIKQLTRRKVK